MATPGVGSIVIAGRVPFSTQGAIGAATMAPLTALGGATSSARADVSLQPLSAEGQAFSGTVAFGDLTLEQLTALGKAPDVAVLVMERVTVSGIALAGTVAFGAMQLDTLVVAGVATGIHTASGDLVLQPLVAAVVASQASTASGALTLRRLQLQGSAVAGTIAFGSLALKALDTAGVAAPVSVATGALTLPRAIVNGFSESVIAETYRTWVMNVSSEALTEYTNSSYNSYARFNNKHYAAGPSGLFEMDGDDDNGTDIAWTIRTGLHDDKNGYLKGLSELLMSVRFNGPIRVKVWTDDATYYEYTLVNFRNDVLHQVRVPTGKGMRSRYYRVELSGMNGAACELESLQIPMVAVKRRAG